MKRAKALATAVALVLGAVGVAAHAQSKLALQVVGNLGITTQYKELEEPFWTQKIAAATNGRITATIKPWNEWIAGWGFDKDAGEPQYSDEELLKTAYSPAQSTEE